MALAYIVEGISFLRWYEKHREENPSDADSHTEENKGLTTGNHINKSELVYKT